MWLVMFILGQIQRALVQ